MRTHYLIISAIVLAAVLILPVGAKATIVPVGGLVNFSITVSADNGVSQADQTFSGSGYANADGTFVWALGAPTAILGGSIDSLKLTVNSDPEVDIEFGFKNGSSAQTWKIISDVVSCDPALVDPTAYASAGITLTDRAPLGATITGLYDGGKTFQATYNGSQVFANLVNGFSISGGTLTGSEDTPTQIINDTVTDIESAFYFRLSANDGVSGTSTFSVVVPEPATMAVFGLGAIALISRKRRS